LDGEAAAAAAATWRWCADFVVPLDLCPWAAASVSAKGGALGIHLSKREHMKEAIDEAALHLRDKIETGTVDPNVAIALVVCHPSNDWDFLEFYDWFEELEESFEDDFFTLAPFHPKWQFGGGPVEHFLELDIEKQSPYPTVTIVCTSVIDKAGPTATDQIAKHNERVLLEMGVPKLQQYYQKRVFPNNAPS
jgi:hypothetical protein